MLAVKQAATEISNRKLFDTQVMEGLTDSLEMIREEAMQLHVIRRRTEAIPIKQLHDEIEMCLQLLRSQPTKTPDDCLTLARISDRSQ